MLHLFVGFKKCVVVLKHNIDPWIPFICSFSSDIVSTKRHNAPMDG
jgi:hypothetical protein